MNATHPPSSRARFAVLAAIGLLVFIGCGTTNTREHRIQTHPEVLAAATPRQRELARLGYIDRGFSADLVLLVLDKPTRIVTDATTGATLWYYHDIYGGHEASIVGAPQVTSGSPVRARAEGRSPTGIDGSVATGGRSLDNYTLVTLTENVVTRIQIVRAP